MLNKSGAFRLKIIYSFWLFAKLLFRVENYRQFFFFCFLNREIYHSYFHVINV